jgi:hypothetical protein
MMLRPAIPRLVGVGAAVRGIDAADIAGWRVELDLAFGAGRNALAVDSQTKKAGGATATVRAGVSSFDINHRLAGLARGAALSNPVPPLNTIW